MMPFRRPTLNPPTILTCLLVICAVASSETAAERANWPSRHAVIRSAAGGSEIVITTTPRVAGAIHSLTWNGQEFIDSFDHGRQLQSAANFDNGTELTAETFNPTEAGSQRDGRGRASSSRLLHMVVTDRALQTTTQMAFWLAPGEASAGHPAKNTQILSDHLLTKRVGIGYRGLPHVIQYHVTFSVPIGEYHTFAQFEAVTGYMPTAFSTFWKFDPRVSKLEALSHGPGEQAHPVVFSTETGSHAMGVYSPDQPSPDYEHAGYGRFRFAEQNVVKWNCVFRVRNPDGIKAGHYTFRTFVVVGDLPVVTQSLGALYQEFADKAERWAVPAPVGR
jgi:hypothetical protein